MLTLWTASQSRSNGKVAQRLRPPEQWHRHFECNWGLCCVLCAITDTAVDRTPPMANYRMYKRFGCSEVNTELDMIGRKSGGSLNFEENEDTSFFLEEGECVRISKEVSVVGISKKTGFPFFIAKFPSSLNVLFFRLGDSRLLNFMCQRFGTLYFPYW